MRRTFFAASRLFALLVGLMFITAEVTTPYSDADEVTAPSPGDQRVESSQPQPSSGSGRIPPSFLAAHPAAPRLMQEVAAPSSPLSLADLMKSLEAVSGERVLLSNRALEESAVNRDSVLEFSGYGRFTWRGYFGRMLSSEGLVLEELPRGLLITTVSNAEEHLITEVLPVDDLLLGKPVTDLDLLSDPYYDQERLVENRIRAKLSRPCSLKFDDVPLKALAEQLSRSLDEPVWLDARAIEETAATLETPISADWRDLPLSDALRWTLLDLGLTYSLRQGMLVITSFAAEEENVSVRIYPCRGLLCESPAAPTNSGQSGGSRRSAAVMRGSGFSGGGWQVLKPTERTAAAPSMYGTAEPGGVTAASRFHLTAMPAHGSEAEQTGQPSHQPAPQPPQAATPPAAPQHVHQPAEPGPPSYVVEYRPIITMIQNAIAPESWEGGDASIWPFRPSLDLVVCNTFEVHEQVESLLSKLRDLPLQNNERGGLPLARPAFEQLVDREQELSALVNAITNSIEPESWEGGDAAIVADSVRLCLVVSQTRDVQDKVQHLLTLLRRSRYEIVHSTRPWESTSDGKQR